PLAEEEPVDRVGQVDVLLRRPAGHVGGERAGQRQELDVGVDGRVGPQRGGEGVGVRLVDGLEPGPELRVTDEDGVDGLVGGPAAAAGGAGPGGRLAGGVPGRWGRSGRGGGGAPPPLPRRAPPAPPGPARPTRPDSDAATGPPVSRWVGGGGSSWWSWWIAQ